MASDPYFMDGTIPRVLPRYITKSSLGHVNLERPFLSSIPDVSLLDNSTIFSPPGVTKHSTPQNIPKSASTSITTTTTPSVNEILLKQSEAIARLEKNMQRLLDFQTSFLTKLLNRGSSEDKQVQTESSYLSEQKLNVTDKGDLSVLLGRMQLPVIEENSVCSEASSLGRHEDKGENSESSDDDDLQQYNYKGGTPNQRATDTTMYGISQDFLSFSTKDYLQRHGLTFQPEQINNFQHQPQRVLQQHRQFENYPDRPLQHKKVHNKPRTNNCENKIIDWTALQQKPKLMP